MSRMLILQLERFGRLSCDEQLALSDMSLRARHLGRGLEIPRAKEGAELVSVLIAGFACRYAVLPNGRRQILAYLLPGEFCDPIKWDPFFSEHRVAALSSVKIATFRRELMMSLCRQFPAINRALELTGPAERAILRQWLLSLGQRSALQRTAHLLCELFTRMGFLGLAHDGVCDLPLRQTDLADALAITSVHVNRTLQEIRRRRLATFAYHQLLIEDFPALQRLGGFQPHYLLAGTTPPGRGLAYISEGRDIQTAVDDTAPAVPSAAVSRP